jgi:hypothetical protein
MNLAYTCMLCGGPQVPIRAHPTVDRACIKCDDLDTLTGVNDE